MTILFECKFGSRVYGTDNENSDDDIKFVYIEHPLAVYKNGDTPQIEKNKDNIGYSLKRFIELLKSSNPMVIEMVNTPKEYITYCDPTFKIFLQNTQKYLSKKLYYSFASFAKEQIKKARNVDNRFNLESKAVLRKTPLDFCNVLIDQVRDNMNAKQGTIPIADFLNIHNLLETQIIINKLDHSKEVFSLFVSDTPTRGICDENSTQLKMDSSKKGAVPFAILIYNEDAYRSHCKQYNEYQSWLKNRNPQRYIDIKNSTQKIDGKNAYHTVRLLNMCLEIFTQNVVNVNRRGIDADYLKMVRLGDINAIDLEDLLITSENKILEIEKLLLTTELPENLDIDFINEAYSYAVAENYKLFNEYK
jgi:uncharacterized protein